MESLLVSIGVVAIAEIGDKTQLLALMLAARYRAPGSIMLGIFLATLLNHGLAAWLGALVAGWMGTEAMRWILGASFLAMAAWILIPDRNDRASLLPKRARRAGAFAATLVAFFLLEIGDKTQMATVALAARFNSIAMVAAGTTLGMMLANLPAVYAGGLAGGKLPFRMIRIGAATVFAALGLAILLDLAPRL